MFNIKKTSTIGSIALASTLSLVPATLSLNNNTAHAATATSQSAGKATTFSNGSSFNTTNRMKDTNGNYIDAHDGHIYHFNGKYYLYGMSYGCGFTVEKSSHFCGVNVYSSDDASTWKYEGNVINPHQNQSMWDANCGGSVYGCFRVKVAYSKETNKYVLWMNETAGKMGHGYITMTSSTPTGQFGNIQHVVPADERCSNPNSIAFGDNDVFVDPDTGIGYLVYTAINTCSSHPGVGSHQLSIQQLDPTMTHTIGSAKAVYHGTQDVESPTMFKRNGQYYVLFGPTCAFCSLTPLEYVKASSPLGPWSTPTTIASKTNDAPGGQPAFVQPITADGTTRWVLDTDRWNQPGNTGFVGNQTTAGNSMNTLSFDNSGNILPITSANQWQAHIENQDADVNLPKNTSSTRVVDTRSGIGHISRFTSATTKTVSLGSAYANKTYMMNITATRASGTGNITAYSGSDPNTSDLNVDGTRGDQSNTAMVHVDSNGQFKLRSQGSMSTDLVVDIQHQINTDVTQSRVLDTRNTSSVAPGKTVTASLPKGGYVNITVRASRSGNLSTNNGLTVSFLSGDTASLMVAPSNHISLTNHSNANVQIIVDYIAPFGNDSSISANPSQLNYITGNRAVSEPYNTGSSDKYAIVQTVTEAASPGYISLYASGNGKDNSSNLNLSPNGPVENVSIVPLSNGVFDSYIANKGYPIHAGYYLLGTMN